ncbi:MAG TPA: hypothetical protein VKB51_18155 [bacterium]|nr:hypothetical protein [bacterium]
MGEDRHPTAGEEPREGRPLRVLRRVRRVFQVGFLGAFVLLLGWMIVGSLLYEPRQPSPDRLLRVEGTLASREHRHERIYQNLPSQYRDAYEIRLVGNPERYRIRHGQFPHFRREAFERDVALAQPIVLRVGPEAHTEPARPGSGQSGVSFLPVYGVEAGGTTYLKPEPMRQGHLTMPADASRFTRASVAVALALLFGVGLYQEHRRRRKRAARGEAGSRSGWRRR